MSIEGEHSFVRPLPEREPPGCADAALAWHSVRYSVGRGKKKRDILRGTSGVALPGRLHGILGPSGSGKTTLLNVLAGRLRDRGGAALSGDVTHGGEPLHESRTTSKSSRRRIFGWGKKNTCEDGGNSAARKKKRVAVPLSYVEQDPKFFSNLTVRETLTLDAKLRGGDETDVDRVLRRLGLTSCADTLVGGDTGGKAVRGVSGGERRRLAIACETLGLTTGKATPARNKEADDAGLESTSTGGIVLADEPTTGLDAHQADAIVEKLREIALEENVSVVAVLHQPRSRSFLRLHDVTLLTSGGRVAYSGPVCEVLHYFETECGHACPTHHNPAEFLIDLVSVDFDAGDDDEAADAERVDALVARWDEHTAARARNAVADGTARASGSHQERSVARPERRRRFRKNVHPLAQFLLLVGRAWRQTKREAWVNGVRLLASAGLAAAFGGCNRNLGLGGDSVKRRAAVLMQACINTSMLAVCRSLNGFPRERATVSREMARSSGGYDAGPYFFSKLLVETPVDMFFPVVFGSVLSPMAGLNKKNKPWFLTTLALETAAASCLGLSVGALSPSSEMALAIGPCVMVLSIMLGDESGAFAEIPESLTAVSHFSLIKWAFRGCLSSEFEGLEFDPLADAKGKAALGAERAGTVGGAPRRARGKGFGVALCPPTGEDVLKGMGLPISGGARVAARAQIRVIAANAVATYLVLKFRGA